MIGIVGGGFAGLAAAYRLQEAGHEVRVFEAADQVGGLAATYETRGDRIERYYHHLSRTEETIVELAGELGLGDRVEWRIGENAYYVDGVVHPLDTPWQILAYPHLSLYGKFRLGMLTLGIDLRGGRPRRDAYADLEAFEDVPVREFLLEHTTRGVYEYFFEPLLDAKFGDRKDDVSAAWLLGRIQFRGERDPLRGEVLGYLDGGFGVLVDELVEAVGRENIETGSYVTDLEYADPPDPPPIVDADRTGVHETAGGPRRADGVGDGGAAGVGDGGAAGVGDEAAAKAGDGPATGLGDGADAGGGDRAAQDVDHDHTSGSTYGSTTGSTPDRARGPVESLTVARTHDDGERTTESVDVDAVVVATMPDVLESLTGYDCGIDFQGSVCAVVSMDEPLLDTYWLNVADDAPFGALIEHTNFVPPERYGGEHLLYVASYVQDTDEELWRLDDEELETLWLDGIEDLFPEFDRESVDRFLVARNPKTAPVYERGYLEMVVPYDLGTAAPGVYYAGMASRAQYPERSLNGAIEAGYAAADAIIEGDVVAGSTGDGDD